MGAKFSVEPKKFKSIAGAKAAIIHSVNVDFSDWMVKGLDDHARMLNISRQEVIKIWIGERLEAQRTKTAC